MESRSFPVPRRASTIGMFLFLAALGMLFASSMLGYVLIRVNNSELGYGSVQLPRTLWVSTLLMIAGSVTIHQAMTAVRRERHEMFHLWLTATLVFAGLFVCVQTPAMIQLYHRHGAMMRQWEAGRIAAEAKPLPKPANATEDERIGVRSVPFYALVMFLILVHALHVIGGMISLGLVARNGFRGKYDHENYSGVRNCVLYWHFLDVVWLVMFAVIGAFG